MRAASGATARGRGGLRPRVRMDGVGRNDYNAINACIGGAMASLTIRNLDDATKTKLRIQAAKHGHSMEEEARTLLRTALGSEGAVERGLGTIIHERFRRLGGVDLQLLRRERMRKPPKLR